MLTATIDELRSAALAADDARGYFPAMYARVTERIELAVESGRFGDGERMATFARSFASWYLRPRSGDGSIPKCWRATFDVAEDESLMIVQHLLLGINAHVNHDLPQVVAELASPAGNLADIRVDFDAVNDILAETLPIVLSSLSTVSRWVNVLAARGGGKVFDFSLDVARAQAWSGAERFHRFDANERRKAAAELDDVVAALAFMVAGPSAPVSWAVAVGRRFEQHDPITVTKALLGPLG